MGEWMDVFSDKRKLSKREINSPFFYIYRKINMRYFLGLVMVLLTLVSNGQLRDSVRIKNKVFSVIYSEKLEQPIWLEYQSKNRPQKVTRSGLDFYTEPNVKTSDNNDYAANVWDKGHLAPAGTFTDSIELMKQTFSFLNCVLQDQYLNRGEWRLLEEQERVWDNFEILIVRIDVLFTQQSQKLSTGATIPSGFKKHIYFTKSKKWRCFVFPNQRPSKTWQNSETICNKH